MGRAPRMPTPGAGILMGPKGVGEGVGVALEPARRTAAWLAGIAAYYA